MKIAIVGAGFTGLSAALALSKNQHTITIYEKETTVGGLAGTFSQPGWEWELEKHYHHWFTNDTYALSLIEEMGLSADVVIPKTLTSIFYDGARYPFNSALDVLSFSPLSFAERLRTGASVAFLKALPPEQAIKLEKYTANSYLPKLFGSHAYQVLWEPLIRGKFGPYADELNMAWFWARIKKRTPRLGYLKRGYHALMQTVANHLQQNGVTIQFNTTFDPTCIKKYDKVIITTPSPVFIRMFPTLPKDYKKRISSIPHLHALNMLLITKEKFLEDIYWLNVNDRTFPFIAVVQQTNMIDASHYGGNHITWVGNYLPQDHRFLTMDKMQLYKEFKPYLQKINPTFNLQLTTDNIQLFLGPFGQPVFQRNYSAIRPDFITPLPNVYLANMDMVYPWDRGTNYAIELGYKVAEILENKT